MPEKVLCIYLQVMVSVQFPKLAVDDVEMLIREEVCNLGSTHKRIQRVSCRVMNSPTKYIHRAVKMGDFKK